MRPYRAILPASGFRESKYRARGFDRIYLEILRGYSSPDTIVYGIEEWDSDPDALLIEMQRFGVKRLMLVAYSWGCGVLAYRLMQKALEYGIHISVACLCDPVFRSRWLPTWLPLNPWSLTRFPTITIPPSVSRVCWVRQEKTIPAGHDLIAEDPRCTMITEPAVLQYSHTAIDDSEEFAAIVDDEAKAFTES